MGMKQNNTSNGAQNMTKSNLIKAVKAVSIEKGVSELEIITEMQAGCVVTGDEKTLAILCDMKWDHI